MCNFCPPGSGSRFRIRIHWPDWIRIQIWNTGWHVCRLCGRHLIIYATLAYIRHFTVAGCYDNDPWYRYLVTNLAGFFNLAGHLDLAGHLELAGFYFSKFPANVRERVPSLNIFLGLNTRSPWKEADALPTSSVRATEQGTSPLLLLLRSDR